MNKLIFISILSFILCGCDKASKTSELLVDTYSDIFQRNNSSKPADNVKEVKSNVKFSANAKASKLLDERRIYLVDVTRSMEGFNGSEDIFGAVKEQLRSAITMISDTTTEVFIVPFTNKPLDLYSEKISNKDRLLNYISNLTTKLGDTNILDAWNKGETLLDSAKINYMFMLTDGVHNTGESIDSLYSTLNKWHKISNGKYQFAFYVLLSENAREQEICRIVESSKQMWLVPTMNIHTDFILGNMNQSVNIINTNKVRMHLTCTNPEIFNRGFKFRLSLAKNEFYRIVNASETLDENGDVSFEIQKLKPQKDLPILYKSKLIVDYDRTKYPFVFFTPEEYNLNIANVGDRVINIKKLDK